MSRVRTMRPDFEIATHLLPGINKVRWATYSMAWSDINGDGRPDLYINNHGYPPAVLFLSDGEMGVRPVEASEKLKDAHTAVWADYDGDGHLELVERSGGGGLSGTNAALYSTEVFEFENGRLKLAGDGLELAYPLSRGRGVTPFDFDGDGRLDVFYGAGVRSDGRYPATVLLQGGDGRYAPAEEFFGSDLSGVGTLIPGRFGDDLAVDFALLGYSGVEVVTNLPQGYRREVVFRNDGTIRDFAVDDFNNDGISDIWIARGSEFDQLVSANGRTLRFMMDAQTHDASGDQISFTTYGPVTLMTATFRPGASSVLYGADSILADPAAVTLDKRSPSTWGRPDDLDKIPGSLGIWYTPETGMWHIEAGRQMASTLGLVRSTFPVWMASYGGLDETPQPRDLLLLGRGDGTFAKTRPVHGVSTMSVTTGDYDNDGDIDVYAVVSGSAGNLRNRLYLNDGSGNFSEPAVPAVRPAGGIGDTATSVDFDADGWLDLLVANGRGPGPFLPDSEYALYRNSGGRYGWLEVKLRAEDGEPVVLGSIITARSGSGKQMRVWDAGVGVQRQDDPDVHFGLERSDFADLVVHWRDHSRSVVRDVPAQTRLTVWRGSDGEDTITGSHRSDALFGGGGDDLLWGRTTGDFLYGGRGADTIAGGRGRDTLSGGQGADVFVFGERDGSDRVLDFQFGIDTLLLRARAGVADFDRIEIDTGPRGTQVRFADTTILIPDAAVPLGESDFLLE